MSRPVESFTAVRETFAGAEVVLLQGADGDVWMTSSEVGRALGYAADKSADAVTKLYDRHHEELQPFMRRIRLRSGSTDEVGEEGAAQGVVREQVCWRREAVYMLACFARTERAREFRAWVVRVCDDLERGNKLLLTREQVQALIDERAGLIDLVSRQAAILQETASFAGRLLADHRHRKRLHPELAGGETPQRFFAFYEAEVLEEGGRAVDGAESAGGVA